MITCWKVTYRSVGEKMIFEEYNIPFPTWFLSKFQEIKAIFVVQNRSTKNFRYFYGNVYIIHIYGEKWNTFGRFFCFGEYFITWKYLIQITTFSFTTQVRANFICFFVLLQQPPIPHRLSYLILSLPQPLRCRLLRIVSFFYHYNRNNGKFLWCPVLDKQIFFKKLEVKKTLRKEFWF